MYIPKTMTKKIADTFYDKTVDIMGSFNETDNEGGATCRALTRKSSFKANVSFSNCKKIQEDFSLDYEIDITVTTDCSIKLDKYKFIKYQDIIYNVTDILASDSHILIVGTKWRE